MRGKQIRRTVNVVTLALATLFFISAALNLGFRIPLGITELHFASPSVTIAGFEVAIGIAFLVSVALSNLYFYGGAYLFASIGIAEGLLSSDVQGLAHTIHELMIPLAAAGLILIAMDARRTYRMRKNQGYPQKDKIVAPLQFFVGALVTLGGAAFARFGTYPIGTALGVVHLLIGLTGLYAGYAFLRRKPKSRSFLIWINAILIAYSAFAESLAEIYAYLPRGINDALIGTIIAITVSGVIIYVMSRSGNLVIDNIQNSDFARQHPR